MKGQGIIIQIINLLSCCKSRASGGGVGDAVVVCALFELRWASKSTSRTAVYVSLSFSVGLVFLLQLVVIVLFAWICASTD